MDKYANHDYVFGAPSRAMRDIQISLSDLLVDEADTFDFVTSSEQKAGRQVLVVDAALATAADLLDPYILVSDFSKLENQWNSSDLDGILSLHQIVTTAAGDGEAHAPFALTEGQPYSHDRVVLQTRRRSCACPPCLAHRRVDCLYKAIAGDVATVELTWKAPQLAKQKGDVKVDFFSATNKKTNLERDVIIGYKYPVAAETYELRLGLMTVKPEHSTTDRTLMVGVNNYVMSAYDVVIKLKPLTRIALSNRFVCVAATKVLCVPFDLVLGPGNRFEMKKEKYITVDNKTTVDLAKAGTTTKKIEITFDIALESLAWLEQQMMLA